MKKEEKRIKPASVKLLDAFLFGAFILLGAASCGQQEAENSDDPNVLADEEHVRDLGYDRGFEGDENEPVSNAEVGEFERWDSNADQRWDATEFETVANETHFYHAWDEDGDGQYSEIEINRGVFNAYDEDEDGSLSSAEFEDFNNGWNREGDLDYEELDANNDDVLNSEEFNSGIYDAGIYDNWGEEQENEGETVPGDRVTNDSRIFGESEIHEGMFRSWDADEDGYLSREEYLRVEGNL